MLPRLDAEERLAGIESAAVAAGSLGERDVETIFNRLEDARDGTQSKPRRAAKASLADLAAMGIAFEAPPVGAL